MNKDDSTLLDGKRWINIKKLLLYPHQVMQIIFLKKRWVFYISTPKGKFELSKKNSGILAINLLFSTALSMEAGADIQCVTVDW